MNFKETKEKNGKAGDGDGESSRESSDGSDESIVSSSSDSDSDSEADIAKKHVLNALHKKELAAAAELHRHVSISIMLKEEEPPR